MGLFSQSKKGNREGFTIYVAEDNAIYMKQMEFYVAKHFGDAVNIQGFPVSEVIDVKLAHGHFPDAIIMDHHLSGKYDDAASGQDALKAIHDKYPKIPLILHSAYENPDYPTKNYISIPKGDQGLENIGKWISSQLKKR